MSHLHAEKAKLDEEKRTLDARINANSEIRGNSDILPDTVAGRIAANERHLWVSISQKS